MSPEEFHRFVSSSPSWLREIGPEGDVVLSTRARLARNVRGYSFPGRATAPERRELRDLALAALRRVRPGIFAYVDLDPLDTQGRRLYHERHLLGAQMIQALPYASLAFSSDERLSAVVNEEDHLRLQSLLPGLQLAEAWKQVDRFDDDLSGRLDFAFDPDLGYLSACPSNLGTGLRLSVMLSLPGLENKDEIPRVTKAVEAIGFTLRGCTGEGSAAIGATWQLSNQSTLGEAEESIVNRLQDFTLDLVERERAARRDLALHTPLVLENVIARNLAILSASTLLTEEEALCILFVLVAGHATGHVQRLKLRNIRSLIVHSRQSHLHHITRCDEDKHDQARCRLVRAALEIAQWP
ncbi:MAG: hypothetical protein RL095_3658 [Verrucomicrobiota bacterium]|jgi:protein arginine kinase